MKRQIRFALAASKLKVRSASFTVCAPAAISSCKSRRILSMEKERTPLSMEDMQKAQENGQPREVS